MSTSSSHSSVFLRPPLCSLFVTFITTTSRSRTRFGCISFLLSGPLSCPKHKQQFKNPCRRSPCHRHCSNKLVSHSMSFTRFFKAVRGRGILALIFLLHCCITALARTIVGTFLCDSSKAHSLPRCLRLLTPSLRILRTFIED